MTKQKGMGYQGIIAIQEFEYENIRSDFKCCYYWEKQYVRVQLSLPETQGEFLDKVTPDIAGFTYEPFVQCDIQFVEILLKMIPNKW